MQQRAAPKNNEKISFIQTIRNLDPKDNIVQIAQTLENAYKSDPDLSKVKAERTALMWAIFLKNEHAVRWLLNKEKELSKKGWFEHDYLNISSVDYNSKNAFSYAVNYKDLNRIDDKSASTPERRILEMMFDDRVINIKRDAAAMERTLSQACEAGNLYALEYWATKHTAEIAPLRENAGMSLMGAAIVNNQTIIIDYLETLNIRDNMQITQWGLPPEKLKNITPETVKHLSGKQILSTSLEGRLKKKQENKEESILSFTKMPQTLFASTSTPSSEPTRADVDLLKNALHMANIASSQANYSAPLLREFIQAQLRKIAEKHPELIEEKNSFGPGSIKKM